MSDLDDLKIPSISDMSADEAIEHLRQIRLARRTPTKQTKKRQATAAKKKAKATPKLSKQQAENLLKLLEGMQDE